jgi:two-component system response regulator HydG
MPNSILLIDDDVFILRTIGAFFEQRGWDVYRELTGEAGLETFARSLPDVVLLDLNLPGMDGLEVLEQLRGRDTAVVLLTGDNDVPAAVSAMRSGAENFLVKPAEPEHLLATCERAAEKGRLRRVNRSLIGRGAATEGFDGLGTSPMMKEVARQLTLLARSDRTPVLIQGEPGTEKAAIARLLHDASPRASEPFLEFADGAGDSEWLETLLVGREGGDATSGERRQGMLEIADGGTLFLAEISDLPGPLQATLVGVLEQHAFRRVGGTREIPVDVRIVAATAHLPSALLGSGRLREDLYYRLNVMPLVVPPLRERTREDLLALIRRDLRELSRSAPGSPTRLTDDALDRLLGHGWPGNTQELHNVIERAMLLARGAEAIGAEHLPGEFRAKGGPFDRRHNPLTMEEVERMHIDRTLKHHGGNRTRAAAELGISRATLIAKIKRYAIPH